MKKKDKNLKVELEFDGFKITSYESSDKLASLTFSRKEGFHLYIHEKQNEEKIEMMIFDKDCDGKSESVQFIFKENYNRGHKGTEKIFEKSDQILTRHMEELEVDKVRKEWEEKLGKYKTKEEYYSDIIKDL